MIPYENSTKVEYGPLVANIRFGVTNLVRRPQFVYDEI